MKDTDSPLIWYKICNCNHIFEEILNFLKIFKNVLFLDLPTRFCEGSKSLNLNPYASENFALNEKKRGYWYYKIKYKKIPLIWNS